MIDESVVPWRGRLQFRQYIKNKSHKYGIKLYKLCTPDGFVYNFKVYTGCDDKTGGRGRAGKVTMELMEDLLDKRRILFTDNFYTSIELCKRLSLRQTMLCGTLRSNRVGLPPIIKNRKIKRAEIIGLQKEGVKIMKWMDKRPVFMISQYRITELNALKSLVDQIKLP